MTKPNDKPLYGLHGFTHGWAILLNVMGEANDRTVASRLIMNEDIEIQGPESAVLRIYEKRSGGLEQLIQANNIQILSKEDWDLKKAEARKVSDRA